MFPLNRLSLPSLHPLMCLAQEPLTWKIGDPSVKGTFFFGNGVPALFADDVVIPNDFWIERSGEPGGYTITQSQCGHDTHVEIDPSGIEYVSVLRKTSGKSSVRLLILATISRSNSLWNPTINYILHHEELEMTAPKHGVQWILQCWSRYLSRLYTARALLAKFNGSRTSDTMMSSIKLVTEQLEFLRETIPPLREHTASDVLFPCLDTMESIIAKELPERMRFTLRKARTNPDGRIRWQERESTQINIGIAKGQIRKVTGSMKCNEEPAHRPKSVFAGLKQTLGYVPKDARTNTCGKEIALRIDTRRMQRADMGATYGVNTDILQNFGCALLRYATCVDWFLPLVEKTISMFEKMKCEDAVLVPSGEPFKK